MTNSMSNYSALRQMTPPSISTAPRTSPPPNLVNDSPSINRKLQLRVLPHTLRILSLTRRALPAITHALLNLLFFPSHGLSTARFFSYTVIEEDVSIICDSSVYHSLAKLLPQHQFSTSATHYITQSSNGTVDIVHRGITDEYRVLECLGYFDVDEVGLISIVSQPLATNKLSFFYHSTFRTGFVLIKQSEVNKAIEALGDDFESKYMIFLLCSRHVCSK
jgi:hypothetical protein